VARQCDPKRPANHERDRAVRECPAHQTGRAGGSGLGLEMRSFDGVRLSRDAFQRNPTRVSISTRVR